MPDDNKKKRIGFVKGIVIFAIISMFFQIGVIFFGSHFMEDKKREDLKAQSLVKSAIVSTFFVEEGRLEQRWGKNLMIYISNESFLQIPYPDRKSIVSLVGEAWCENVSQWHLPKVYLCDIRSGKTLATYSCVFGYASIK